MNQWQRCPCSMNSCQPRYRVVMGRDILTVSVIALDRIAPFELGVVCEVFGTDRTADGFPGYEFVICSVDGKPVRTQSGFDITPHADLTPLGWADLVVVPAHPVDNIAPEPALAALRAANDRGA